MERSKVVIGLSGGMDSTTLLASMLSKGFEVHCCTFIYGSKHNAYEKEAANSIVKYFQHRYGISFVVHRTYDLNMIFQEIDSNLLRTGGEIPEGHFEDDSMKLTIVPGRNLIFASIMLGLAESIGASTVALGVHSGDHHIYPDCRPEFINHLSMTGCLSTDGKVEIIAPFQEITKVEILRLGYASTFILIPPYRLTRTCYKDQEIACGKCGSCQERLEAFAALGMIDPIQYE